MLSFLIIITALVFALFYKKHQCKLIVITNNYELILTKVNATSKKQAEEIVLKVNEVLNCNYNELKVC